MPGMVTTMVSRRDFLQGISALSVSDLVRQGAEAEAISAKAPSEPPPQQLNGTPAHPEMECGNSLVRVRVSGSSSDFWSLERRASGQIYRFGCPIFPLGGKSVPATLKEVRAGGAVERLKNGVTECSFEGPLTAAPSLLLRMTFRIAPDNPVVRFRYSLANQGAEAVTFEKADGRLTYLSMSFADMSRVKEVRLSDFNSMLHSDTVSEFDIPQRWFAGELNVAGPILIGESQGHEALLLAYEHGSQMPDTFLRFDLQPDRVVKLVAVKGNYLSGRALKVFDSVWMEAAVCPAGAVASQFRTFVRKYLEAQGESRRPYLYYNTWNFQERNKWWNGKGYFTSYNEERMLQEIDIAHTMGLEIFVMVSGWHGKTGDWEVNRERFPHDLKKIKARLDQHGMKLGLWFNPTMAAVSSKILAAYRSCILSWKGKLAEPGDVWGSEVSYPMCLVSAYADAYADTVIRVARETGARYFVWDAVAQYGCDSVGLSFLSAGRFFLINNGPYLVDYDLPHFSDTESDNIFFYPGTARTWICRRPLTYDEWIPSNLFLTHYLPDDPASSQLVNMASLILGQNGIWGDLPKVSEAGVQWIGEVMGRYKQVREDMAESDPIRTGEVAGVYEVHEKISNSSNRGAVVLFSATKGRIVYVTEHTPKQTFWATPGTKISFDGQGHAVLENDMESGAAIAFFGVG